MHDYNNKKKRFDTEYFFVEKKKDECLRMDCMEFSERTLIDIKIFCWFFSNTENIETNAH